MEYAMAASRFVAVAISIYTLLIWVRVMLTWVQIPGVYFQSSPLLRLLSSIVDPYLDMFRHIRWARRGHIDFSPVVALMVLSILQSIFSLFGAYGRITPPMVASLVIQAFWNYILAPLCWFAMLVVGIQLFLTYRSDRRSTPFVVVMEGMSRSFIDFVQRLFFGHRLVGLRRLAWWSFAFYLVLYFLLRFGTSQLASYLIRL
ncbi:MAG: YggT family protein [Sphaerochaetaceae bacterium]|nr:YggT family protein [Spirochaetales bacterium]MDY5499821.1 YggT family protein [Sphaerochaetaceae bacterium]